ncbi:tRNA threonylcarbamoyladenosine biosynthesis protein TsaB [Arachidicoccus rhizosphaerae]|jgi:tRNA threonylcarbamoyladenosine biosynthesis protein TsaB|uniref:tRNA threonylcarbamoyladenosine biosynthesis protein TsaB n=1 Tax=Arachidicoccus rhizosphaerae TaxID=551991 RepID=A0A1H3VT77_9BACT|nr:tRNA (adenosine(37)-N6)-threonylcarbamoyltransferase complex dimerization subunit type 1 TsaB [Arachidicoccus rhizosphaerae]SDZ77976.1 tRNA threonylcarbamoyladenosine biosynthesis protein TsaB [Arachidicoccus rhizosphaerae]
MATWLHIDSAVEEASVSLWENDKNLAEMTHEDQKSHASFLQTSILNILEKTGKQLTEIDAVSVSGGPGSYTGLRVGLASAKGICYTLNKPLVLLNTLEIMAEKLILNQKDPADFLYAPMIDARRMEVFCALYDHELNALLPPGAYLLDGKDFEHPFLDQRKTVCFFGSGMQKWKEMTPKGNFVFADLPSGSKAQHVLAKRYFDQNRLADVAYSEPLYFKSFYTTAKVH